MVNKNIILGSLTPFQNKENVVVENQGVNDIITGILQTHSKYQKEYDKIYPYFVGSDLQDTAKNVWNFLKKNVPYYIESNDLQYLKSPSSIICTPSDCKSYALFSAGVMDAYRRNENPDIEVLFRFASYDPFDKVPQHVFTVVRGEGEEFWIDPVLDKFNERKQPYFYKDKNINKMALVGLSGVRRMGDVYDTGSVDTSSVDTGSSSGVMSIFNSILNATPAILKALPQSQTSSVYKYPTTTPTATTTSSSGISTNTLLLLGAVGIGAYFLLRKK